MENIIPKFNTIMVIDDDPIDIFIAEKILTDSHYSDSIISYINSKLALSYLANVTINDKVPDLILLDLNMPVFSGEEFLICYHQKVCESIRKKIKLVVLTAYKFFPEATGINFIRFPSLLKIIDKPLEIEELEEVNEHFIERLH